MTSSQKREIWIGVISSLCINLILFFIPGFFWLVWLVQLIYLIPASIILVIYRRNYIVGALWIVGGSTFILNVALCGYAASHPR